VEGRCEKNKNLNRYTICLPPKDMNDSYQKVAVSVDLSKPAILSKVLDIPYAIQKPSHTHLVLAHSLHNTAYLVTGEFGSAQIENLLGKKAIMFGNKKNHLFDSKHPHLPVVLNTDDIPGVSESTVLHDLFQQTPVPVTSETNSTCKLTVLCTKPRVIIAHTFIHIITRSI
jgi:hypothetical protein